MDLTLAEIETLKGISRYQISRYAKDGRLQRTRQGHYDAASLANLAPPFDRYAAGRHADRVEERAVWLVRQEHSFRRELVRILERRHRDQGCGRVEIDVHQQREVDEAVKAYVATLAAMPER